MTVIVFAAGCSGVMGSSPSVPSAPADPGGSDPADGKGAAQPPQPFVVGELIQLDLPRSEAAVTADDVAAVVRGDRALGLDLLRVAAADENVMVSPYSVATALSMMYPGARGKTAAEIADVMHLDVDDDTLHEVHNSIDAALGAPPAPQEDDDTREPFAIRPANSAWGQGGYPFLDEYLTVLATHYGAGLRLLDFINNPHAATDTINDWTEEATEDRIQDLIPPDVIDELTRLVLVNAIWFKANWAEQFDPDATSQGPFTLLDGSQATVPLMHGSIRTGYAETDLFQAARLPYAGDAAMVIALPKTGTPAELAAALDPDDLNIPRGDYMVDLTLPRFDFESEVALKQALQDLGMRRAFVPPLRGADDEADLTGITAIRELYVSEALHKTFVAVDEHGTEAAAATALIIGITSAPTPVTFTVDRPFLFWIEHIPTTELLFLGQVTNPATN